MRIPDLIIKCVVYLGIGVVNEKTGEKSISYKGTGFFVSVKATKADASFMFLVTARHVAEKANANHFFVRLNTAAGKSMDCWI